jgi:DNA-binding transcriptional MocR family regulator
MDATPLYQRIARHYRGAIQAGTLSPGEALPSVRALTRLHQVSLTTALQACRSLEDEGLVEARPRAGYFVRRPRRAAIAPPVEPDPRDALDAAQYVGIHDRVSQFVALTEAYAERHPVVADFAATYAAPPSYPGAELKQAAMRALRRDPELLARPAPAAGEPALRAALARRALSAGMRLAPDEIVVTHGCIEALNVALRAVTQRGDTVAVESPSYFGLLQVLESLGLRALEIPTSPSTGLSVDALAFALQNTHDLKAVVVVPNLQNPLSSVMPDAEKARLVALCAQHGVALIEDDTYAALHDGETPLSALKAYDETGNVIHCASLRKTLAPGMRLGWIGGGVRHARVQMLRYAQSRANEALSQLAMAEFLASGACDRHLARLRRLLRHQREQVAEAIAAHFPPGTRLGMPAGGMLLWVELPEPCDAQRVCEAALAQGIRVVPGSLFSNSRRFDHHLRISCGAPFTREAEQALRRLAEIVATV